MDEVRLVAVGINRRTLSVRYSHQDRMYCTMSELPIRQGFLKSAQLQKYTSARETQGDRRIAVKIEIISCGHWTNNNTPK